MNWVCPSCGTQNDECLKCTCGFVTTDTTSHQSQIKPHEMKYAGFWKRFASILIDAFIFLPFFFAYYFFESISKPAGVAIHIVNALFAILYSVIFIAKYGQTPGKMAVAIKVVKVNGDRVSWNEAILRHSFDIVFAVAGGVAVCIAISKMPSAEYVALTWKARTHRMYELYPDWYSWVTILSNIWIWSELVVLLLNKKRRALHDFIAGTVVIHAETAAANQEG